MRRRLADLLVAAALRLYPDGALLRTYPDGEPVDDQDRITDAQWASPLVLHAEAVHGCEHTDQARRGLGLAGPRGRAAS